MRSCIAQMLAAWIKQLYPGSMMTGAEIEEPAGPPQLEDTSVVFAFCAGRQGVSNGCLFAYRNEGHVTVCLDHKVRRGARSQLEPNKCPCRALWPGVR